MKWRLFRASTLARAWVLSAEDKPSGFAICGGNGKFLGVILEGKGGGGIKAVALATGLGVKAGGGMIDLGTVAGVTGGEGTSASPAAAGRGLHEATSGPRSNPPRGTIGAASAGAAAAAATTTPSSSLSLSTWSSGWEPAWSAQCSFKMAKNLFKVGSLSEPWKELDLAYVWNIFLDDVYLSIGGFSLNQLHRLGVRKHVKAQELNSNGALGSSNQSWICEGRGWKGLSIHMRQRWPSCHSWGVPSLPWS